MELWKLEFGLVRQPAILELEGGTQAATDASDHWRHRLARVIPTSRFASPQQITTLTLAQL